MAKQKDVDFKELLQPLKLSEVLTLVEKPKYILGTTYSLSLVFFESTLFPLLDRSALHACVILCDQLGYARALEEASALQSAGQDYFVAAVAGSDCFHCKVWIVANDQEVLLLVGSGNLTQAGFIRNAEVFSALYFSDETPITKELLQDVQSFVEGLRKIDRSKSAPLWVEALAELKQCLADLPTSPTSPHRESRFISSFTGQIINQLPNARPSSEIFAAAPFFGGSTAGVKMLLQRFKGCRLQVIPAIHPPGAVDVSIAELTRLGVKVPDGPLRLSAKPKGAFQHLKLYGGEGENGDAWLFCGSANCTSAALTGPNVEAGIIQLVPRAKLPDYFAVDPIGFPDEKLLSTRDDSKAGHLVINAVDTGGGLLIHLDESFEDSRPITDVKITIKGAMEFASVGKPLIFETSNSAYVSWTDFPNWRRPRRRALRVDLEGKSKETVVHASCFVDNELLLSAEPIHRSAWRGALAILETEGVPELADIGAIFSLARDVFDVTSIKVQSPSGEPAKRDSRETPAGPALWPPQADLSDHRGHIHKRANGDVRWFQEILHSLLQSGERSHLPAKQEADEDDSDDNGTQASDAPERLARQAQSQSIAERLWKQTRKDYEKFADSFQELIPSDTNAAKVWPVAIFTFLATMAMCRAAQRISGDVNLDVTPAILIDDFIRLMLLPRTQGPDFVPPRGFVYKSEKFDALADDLAKRFHHTPDATLARVMMALFVDKRIREGDDDRFGAAWAHRLRQIGAPELGFDDSAKAEIRAVWNRLLKDDAEVKHSNGFDTALDWLVAIAAPTPQ